MVQTVANQIFLAIDSEDNTFCAFQHFPELIKYDKNFEHVLTIRLDELPEIKKAINVSSEKISKSSGKNIYGIPQKYRKIVDERIKSSLKAFDEVKKFVIKDIAVDNKYIYVVVFNNTLYYLDKNSGKIIKKIKLYLKYSESASISNIDTSSEKYIYATDINNMLILRFDK